MEGMKDRLETSWWENLFPKNPTQTRYTRFMKVPYQPIDSQFSKAKDEWDRLGQDWKKTRYLEV